MKPTRLDPPVSTTSAPELPRVLGLFNIIGIVIGLFFKSVARVHPRSLTPHVSIILLAAWAGLLSLSGTFEQLFSFVIFGFCIFMGLTVLGVMILRRKPSRRSRRSRGTPTR